VTYGGLLQERRKTLHAQIVAAIERLYADRLSEHVESLAHHALRGALWDKAVRYSRQAGNRALDRSAFREMLGHFDQAQVALQELPESRERMEQRIDLCFEQHFALLPLAEFARVGEVLGEAHALAERLGDQRRLGRALAYQAQLLGLLGEHAQAIEAGERACDLADAVDDLGLRVVANIHLGVALWNAGDLRRTAQPVRAVIALLEDAPPRERFGMAGAAPGSIRWALAAVLAELGEFAEALATGEEGLRIAQNAGRANSEVWVRWGLGRAHLRHGDFVQATRVLEPGLALCRGMEIHFALPFLTAVLGSAYLWSERAADAVPLVEEAAETFRAMRIPGYRSSVTAFLAEAYLVLGRIAEAREQAEQAVALTRAHQLRGWEAWSLKALGDVHAHEPVDAEKAADTYRRALALAAELGMRPLVAHCHLGLGKLYRQTTKLEQARENFMTATTMYREMDMQFWLDKAQTAVEAF
jgi:tetratricopeptide (TPR) repeat protein